MSMKRERSRGWGYRLAVLATAVFPFLGMANGSNVEAAVVRVSTDDALPGGPLSLRMSIQGSPGDPPIAGVQADLILSTEQLDLIGACSSDASACENGTNCPNQGRCVPTCQASAGLTQHSLAAAYPDFQNVATGRRRLRLPINPNLFPPAALSEGLLLTCTFGVLPGAAFGPVEITADLSRFRVTDEASDPIPSTLEVSTGAIVSMLATVTPTPTETLPPPTVTATVESTVTPTETSTAEPTATATEAASATQTQEPTPTPSSGPTETSPVPPTQTATFSPVVPTATRTQPQPTATTEATATRSPQPTLTLTQLPATSTPTLRPGTATPTTKGKKDNDGCSMASDPISAGSWLVLLLVPLLLGAARNRVGVRLVVSRSEKGR